MADVLDFFGQRWAAARPGELTLFLWHSGAKSERIGFTIDMELFPPWSLERDEEGGQPGGEHRTMTLTVDADVPRTGDWRGLQGLRVEGGDEKRVMGECVSPRITPPEIELYSRGHGPIHYHAKHLWETAVTFGQREGRDPCLLPFGFEAFCPSDRARAASIKLGDDEIKSWFGDPVPEDFEAMEQVKEGRWLRFDGHCRFDKVFCAVPVNASDPIGYARALAKRELGLEEFGFCHVNGGNRHLETWSPENGLMEGQGRLVILETISDYHRRHASEIIQAARSLAARELVARSNPPMA